MDNIRYLMVVLVVVHHSVGAYAIVAPHWIVHDTNTFGADIIRELLDGFMMPVLFFAAGYFALPSLEKKGPWKFVKDKVKRLLVPWALVVLIILPLVLYDQPVKPVRPFWKYWLSYLSSFEVQLRFTQAPVVPTTQAIYWFISLLFAFFLLFALICALTGRCQGGAIFPAARKSTSGHSALVALVVFGVLISDVYFILLLFVPDSSWFTLYMFLEFQVTRLVMFAGYFAFGVYAQSRGWFADGKPLGSLTWWGALSLGLAIAYLVFGQAMFADTAGTADLTVGYLLIFAFLRSFILLSLLVILVSFGVRYWNNASGLGRQLAAASYNIYLVHFFIVVALQAALLRWIGGPAPVKIAIVFLAALTLSFAFSRWVLTRHSRAFVIAILALFVFCLVSRP
ncbi:MAG: acyltransferase family protein [Deltaproteobacteria bacterium]|nr:acyltransferase family protein [Deltaproteobacteria bacterium]